MYARRLNRSYFSIRIDYGIVYSDGVRSFHSRIASGNGFLPPSRRFQKLCRRWQSSSGAEGRDGSEDMPKPRQKGPVDHVMRFDAHVRSGEEEQKEWIRGEKMAVESQRKESPFLSRRERLKNELLQRIIPWDKISVTFDKFPYYIHENTKNILLECVSSHMKQMKLDFVFGDGLRSSSGRILLQSIPGTELYRERLIKALARELEVPLLVVDNSFLTFNSTEQDCYSECDVEDDAIESGEEGLSDAEVDDDNDNDGAEDDACGDDEWAGCNDSKSGSEEDDSQVSENDIKKLVPCNLENFAQMVSSGSQSSFVPSRSTEGGRSCSSKFTLKKGDRVKYIGRSLYIEADKRSLSAGQRGEVYEVNGDQVAVILDACEKKGGENHDYQSAEEASPPSIYWIHVKEIERDLDMQSEDYYIMMKALCEVLSSKQPIITYFPDFYHWISMTVPKSKREEFVGKVQAMLHQLGSHVVLISGHNKIDSGSQEKQKFTVVLPNFGRLPKLPLSIKRLTEGLKSKKRTAESEVDRLFTNVISIPPPKDDDLFQAFSKQIEEDERIILSRRNLSELHKVILEHELTCMDLFNVRSDGLMLTKQDAEKVVGWARNHYLSSCILPCVIGDKLLIPRESLEIALSRLRELSLKPTQNLKKLAKDEYESNFVSAVVPPGEIGVKFDDIGALEDVKKSLNELVILPMRRPELFAHGNLLRPCKGILLFGPPGTGKTLLAKALATEAGANFISVTGSNLTSKWFGDAEKLTKALFSFAERLAPVIIFVDEVDSLLGARGGTFEHEATRRMRNEFMAAWDGLRSKDSQRILVLGATNRPFDLDDAVIRRLPRRIYVDLPDAGNRLKILKIYLARENIENGFEFEKLANTTEGYSGSDLKNLCIAAAYRPVQELLEDEVKLKERDREDDPSLRPLCVDDFIQSKSKVGPSVAYDAASMNELRKWNEQYGEGGSRRKSPFGFGD